MTEYICRKTLSPCMTPNKCYPAPVGPGLSACAIPSDGRGVLTIEEVRRIVRDEMIRCRVLTKVEPD